MHAVAPAVAAESRWEKAIATFEAADRENPPPAGGILFIGSSSIRMWNLDRYFADFPVIHRGFGGSEISDSIEFAPRIVLPYRPRIIVLYAGDNDVAKGKSAEVVARDFDRFVGVVHEELPTTRIVFIAIKPSISRWRLVGEMRRANELIRTRVESDDRLAYVDIDTPMIGDDGKPRPELFVSDGLHLSTKGYDLWAALVLPHLELPVERGQLRVASCQFPVSANVAENAEWIRRQTRDAAARHAQLVHFSECALSGYAGVDHKTLEEFDWDLHERELASIRALAKELGVWVVVGAAHRLEKHKPHNSLYVIDPNSAIVDRYDKRFCTGGDLRHYSPGDHFVTFDVNGVKCGLLICYDIRFPELFRQYHLLGAQLVLHSFYNARQKPGAIHPKIMPPTAQARAATNYLFLSVTNSSARHSWESLFVTPDGLIARRLRRDEPGVMVNLVDTRKRYYDASRPYREGAIHGKLNSGEVVDDARSKDRAAP